MNALTLTPVDGNRDHTASHETIGNRDSAACHETGGRYDG